MRKIALFDADGVLVTPGEPFSHTYFRKQGLDPLHGEPFFRGPFQEALRGRADLKELIVKHNDIWQWSGDPQKLLDEWFATENHPNKKLLKVVSRLRENGVRCYLATDQEKYRYKYLTDVMFAGQLDGIFASCQFGHVKREPAYFAAVLKQLPDVQASDIIYFDDSEKNIAAAKETGIDARLYTPASDVDRALIV